MKPRRDAMMDTIARHPPIQIYLNLSIQQTEHAEDGLNASNRIISEADAISEAKLADGCASDLRFRGGGILRLWWDSENIGVGLTELPNPKRVEVLPLTAFTKMTPCSAFRPPN